MHKNWIFIFILFITLTAVTSNSSLAASQCPRDITLNNGIGLFLNAERENNQVCMMTIKNKMTELLFNSNADSYLAFFNSIRPLVLMRSSNESEDKTDAVLNLVKGFQDNWLNKYLFKAIDTHEISVLLSTMSGATVSTLSVLYIFSEKSDLKKGAFKAWFMILKSLFAEKNLMVKLFTGIGASSQNLVKQTINQNFHEKVYPAPYELLDISDSLHWSHSDFTLVRNVITFSTSAVTGALAADFVSKRIANASTTLQNAIPNEVPVRNLKVYNFFMKIYGNTLKPLVLTLSKAGKSSLPTFIISYAVTNVVLEHVENGLNYAGKEIAIHNLEEIKQSIINQMKLNNDFEILAHAENHVGALSWLTAVKSKRALNSFASIEEDYAYNLACDSFSERLMYPVKSEKERRDTYSKKMREEINEALAKWSPHRLDNINYINQEIIFVRSLNKPYLNHLITRLEALKGLYMLSGSLEFQMQIIHQRAISRIGEDFFLPKVSSSTYQRVNTELNCPTNHFNPNDSFQTPY